MTAGICFRDAPDAWGECERDQMEPVWVDGFGGWGCAKCKTIIGPLDIVDKTKPTTPGWRDGQELLRLADLGR